MADKRPALGRGLSALIPDRPKDAPRDASLEVDLDLLEPNPYQPRLSFDDERIDELTRSIKAHGVIQPILVRRKGTRYEIIAGERRWRAAQRAGLLKVPIVTREVSDDRLLQVALIENIQRENLNPIDEAQAYQRLIDEFALTQEQVAEAVGKDRSSVANYLRLLRLAPRVKELVSTSALSMGHARALLALEQPASQVHAAEHVVAQGLSVRGTEALVRKLSNPPRPAPPPEEPADVHTRQAEDRLKLALGTRVHIVNKGGKGRIEIEFVSEEELQRLYERLTARW